MIVLTAPQLDRLSGKRFTLAVDPDGDFWQLFDDLPPVPVPRGAALLTLLPAEAIAKYNAGVPAEGPKRVVTPVEAMARFNGRAAGEKRKPVASRRR